MASESNPLIQEQWLLATSRTPTTDSIQSERTSLIHHMLFPEIISLIFEFYVCPTGWEGVWYSYLFRRPFGPGKVHYPQDYFKPLVLGAVCQLWRDIAWSTPQLWNKIFIISDFTKNNARTALECKRLRAWLARSGDLPLTLYVACIRAGDQSATTSTPRLIRVVNEYSSRWSHLNLRGNAMDISNIVARLSSQSRPRRPLNSLKIKPEYPGYHYFHHVFRLSKMVMPPSIEISLEDVHYSIDLQPLMNMNWINVTDLHLQIRRAAYCIYILEHAPQLLSLRVHIFPTESQVPGIDMSKILIHHRLQIFVINGRVGFSYLFFRKLALPALTQLHFPFTTTNEEGSSLGVFRSFIKRSGCSLKSLNLIDINSREQDLLDICADIPSLEDLHISTHLWSVTPNRIKEIGTTLLAHITLKSLLPNLRAFSYIVTEKWQYIDNDHNPIHFILAVNFPRRPLDMSSPPLTTAFNLLMNRDLMDERTVLCFRQLKTAEINVDTADCSNGEEVFARCIDFHDAHRFQ